MAAARTVVMGAVAALVVSGCATTTKAAAVEPVAAPAVATVKPERQPLAVAALDSDHRYVDPDLGFEISRPAGDWMLEASDELTPEGLAVPVVLRERQSGAQVVVQVAPAVASATQFAERLTAGLRNHPGFSATDPEPVPLSDGAVGFQFALGDKLQGKVAVLEGKRGQMFMMMATWPADASAQIHRSVDEIFGSLKTLPPAAAVTTPQELRPRPVEHYEG